MSQDQDLATRVSQIFSMDGGSWRDYALVADIEPPRIVRGLPSIALLEIADEDLANACRKFLFEQGVRAFANFDELNSAFCVPQPAGDEMTTYSSPAGFYTVEHPANWRISRDENILNILPPEGGGEVTISAFHGDEDVTPMTLNTLIGRVFKDFKVISPLRPLSQNNWDGLHAEYLQSTDTGLRWWLVIGACYHKTMVLITANDTKEAMVSQRTIYETILNSLHLDDPEKAEC